MSRDSNVCDITFICNIKRLVPTWCTPFICDMTRLIPLDITYSNVIAHDPFLHDTIYSYAQMRSINAFNRGLIFNIRLPGLLCDMTHSNVIWSCIYIDYIYIYVCVYVFIVVCVSVCVYLCVYIYIYTYICICVIYLHMRARERERDVATREKENAGQM